jgi:hypothetical protein
MLPVQRQVALLVNALVAQLQYCKITQDKFRTDYLPPARLKVTGSHFGRVDSIRSDSAKSFVFVSLRSGKKTDYCLRKVTEISNESDRAIPAESYAAGCAMNQHEAEINRKN